MTITGWAITAVIIFALYYLYKKKTWKGKEFIKKYLPDILINVGIWVYAFNNLYEEEAFGVVVIALGINIAVRRYLSRKK